MEEVVAAFDQTYVPVPTAVKSVSNPVQYSKLPVIERLGVLFPVTWTELIEVQPLESVSVMV